MTGRNKAIFFKRGLKIRQNRKLPGCQVFIDQGHGKGTDRGKEQQGTDKKKNPSQIKRPGQNATENQSGEDTQKVSVHIPTINRPAADPKLGDFYQNSAGNTKDNQGKGKMPLCPDAPLPGKKNYQNRGQGEKKDMAQIPGGLKGTDRMVARAAPEKKRKPQNKKHPQDKYHLSIQLTGPARP